MKVLLGSDGRLKGWGQHIVKIAIFYLLLQFYGPLAFIKL
jgi:hypothetical protein